MRLLKFSIIGLLLLILATGCDAESLTGVKQISVNDIPQRMAESVEKNDGAIYIDVREEYEYNEAYIEGFVNFPLSTLGETYTELPQDKEIIIICRSGNRSMQAATMLQEKGYENVTNVQGAMLDWKGETKSNN
ncbi:rhodanese-like domain-containing protein [Anaerobacillus sp. CMMVII]|uniref:rhodanese-like domain-containing protein n=1 Tax=Anaerobacillus sp. CMMVII TaxID=2755588 RepID=UPI0021B7B929|nr:rhodanese-like domain-containing protein [Anaerobacillus sp. CMMVII]MCT8136552.1 rhodanese-like domain-containing protein [Anaerobacillus sp. CMMVII]